MGDDGLGPLFGSLPPDVLKQVILPELDLLQRGLFALASGACWRAMKDSGLSCRLEKGCLLFSCERRAPGASDTCASNMAAPGALPRASKLRGKGTWSVCGARTSMAAPGALTRALVLQGKGSWSVCGTRTSTAAPGMLSRALGLQGKGSWSVCGWRTSTAAPGMLTRALVLRGTGSWSACSTRTSMAAPGMLTRALMLRGTGSWSVSVRARARLPLGC